MFHDRGHEKHLFFVIGATTLLFWGQGESPVYGLSLASSVTGFSTLHDIYVFRCYVACGISDNLAGDKRRIVLIISVLRQTIAARSYEKTYNLADIMIG